MKIFPEIRDEKVLGYLMRSPASGQVYCFWTKEGNQKVNWSFNGNYENPTFRPSMKNCTTGEHFFVTNGKIEYLLDCKHNMAGQTVDMVDME